jgi:phenylalanyl-tRNA synthetase beta chain
MKFTFSWLRQHLDTDRPLAELAERLTMLGLEVEGIHDPAKELAGFTVARIAEAVQHPNADRLRVCTVETGSATLQVVCGAPNARAGIKVILAQPGTVIPATSEALKKGAIRGVESQGMLCSWRELAMGEDHEGIAELDPDAPVGAPLTDVLPVDPVVEISLTPNRPDCLGVRGIARDLAAAGMGRLKPLEVAPVPGAFASPIKVTLDFSPDKADACPLFAGRYVRGVKNGESPQWLKDRLTAIGLRPISALVDITNFFTYDLARPLHVFDADKVKGNIHARLARPSETLRGLNGKDYTLNPDVTVIADDAGPEGLAGVMGGEPSGVSEATVNVFLECALFDPLRTAATGRALTIESDARHRFERHVDPAFCVPGMELATRMILDLCGGEASVPEIAGREPDWRRSIVLRPERVEQMSGLSIPLAEIERILIALGCTVAAHDAGLRADPPSWRADLVEEYDLVEEVIRVHGYDHLPLTPLPREPMPKPVLTPAQRRTGFVRRHLATRGMVEAITWSFMPAALAERFGGGQAALILSNPISADLDAMRPSILPNLIAAAGRNADRGMRDVALFEIGAQFEGDRPADQRQVAAGLRAGRTALRHWADAPRPVDLFDAKADMQAALAAAGISAESLQTSREAPGWYHPGRSGALKQGPKVLGWFGEIHPAILAAMDVKGPMVGFELFLDQVPLPKARATKAKPMLRLSPFQPVERDFAFVVDRTVEAEKLIRAAKGADRTLVAEVTVFDAYEGDKLPEGKKSLAVAVTLQPTERTLTDADIEAVSAKIVAAVGKATGGTLRA